MDSHAEQQDSPLNTATGLRNDTIIFQINFMGKSHGLIEPIRGAGGATNTNAELPTDTQFSTHSGVEVGRRNHASPTLSYDTEGTMTLTLMKIDSFVFDSFVSLVDQIREFGRDAIDFFNQTYLPIETVYRVSIAALIAQFIHRQLLIPLQYHHQSMQQAFSTPSPWHISAHLLWILPILTTIISLSLSLTLLLQWNPAETVVMAGLIALLIVECLTPMAIAGCTALFLVQALTWDR